MLHFKEKFTAYLVYKLPRYLVMWCAIRVIAYASSGKYGSTIVPELSAMDAIKRWEDYAP